MREKKAAYLKVSQQNKELQGFFDVSSLFPCCCCLNHYLAVVIILQFIMEHIISLYLGQGKKSNKCFVPINR